MRSVCTLLFCAALLVAPTSAPAHGQQPLQQGPPFRLEITGYTVPGHYLFWDFSNQSPITRKAGEMIVIGERKRNISNQEIGKVSHEREWCGGVYEIRDSGGKVMRPNKISHGDVGSANPCMGVTGTKSVVIQPGADLEFQINLTDSFEFEPGTYTFQIWAHASNRPGAELVKSNILMFTVLPADEPPADKAAKQ